MVGRTEQALHELAAWAAENGAGFITGRSASSRGYRVCSECVRGRLPFQEALRDELGPLLLAPAVQHLEI